MILTDDEQVQPMEKYTKIKQTHRLDQQHSDNVEMNNSTKYSIPILQNVFQNSLIYFFVLILNFIVFVFF